MGPDSHWNADNAIKPIDHFIGDHGCSRQFKLALKIRMQGNSLNLSVKVFTIHSLGMKGRTSTRLKKNCAQESTSININLFAHILFLDERDDIALLRVMPCRHLSHSKWRETR